MSDIRWSGDAGPRPDDAVESVLAACLEREPAERAVAFEHACSTHPELATDLRQRWSALAAMGLVDTLAPTSDAPEFPEQLGDFRLVRRLGGGGMGVVYLAVQTSLARDVALKLVRPEQLFFPRAKERFRREAEAIARLAHPGIVPIHMVGEENGLPFFAMELVRGCTLAEALASLEGRAPESLSGRDLEQVIRAAAGVDPDATPHPFFERSWVDTCLALARQVADALEHAHGRGLIHRDVKPSNVMVTPDGRARLVDFGLTAVTEVASTTRTGAQLGTLHYMAPEQVRASKDVDVRADVYGLGVTLYELLSLQLPYRGEDALEVQHAILDGRADSLRARNRNVAADVETVVTVAMERDATRRYASAGALAHDLFNLLERRPIAARPPGAWVRIARLAQRRPALTASFATALVLAIATPSALLWQSKKHARELANRASLLETALGNERDARREADDQRTVAHTAELTALDAKGKAQDNAAAADAALEFMIEMFHEAAPQTSLGQEITARELLERGADEIESKLADRPAARARLQSGIGEVFYELGQYEQAQELLEAAHEAFEELDDPTLEAAAHRTASNLTIVYERSGDLGRAEALARETLERVRDRVDEDPQRFVFALNHLAVVLLSQERWREAEPLAQELIQFLETHAVPNSAENLAANLSVLGQAAFMRGDAKLATSLAERGLAIQRELIPPIHPELATTLQVLAYYRKQQDRLPEAGALYDESVCVMESLGLRHGFDLANALHNWAVVRLDVDDFVGALELFARADEVDRRTEGSNGRIQRMCLYGRGRVAMEQGRFAEAIEAFDAAARAFLDAANPLEEWTYGLVEMRRAKCAAKLDRAKEALASYEQAASVLTQFAGARRDTVECWENVAALHEREQRNDHARAALDHALAIADADPRMTALAEKLRERRAALP